MTDEEYERISCIILNSIIIAERKLPGTKEIQEAYKFQKALFNNKNYIDSYIIV